MTITIGAFSTNRLTAQPFGYEGEARRGLTARTFTMSGLLTPAEWQTLVAEYNSWRSTRIQDADTLQSGVVGTTIGVTITSTNNLSVTGLACWFADPPSGEQTGRYVSATVVMVDAAQALQVLLREEEKSRQNSEALRPSLGTLTLGNVTVTLTKPMETFQDGPQVSLTASGKTLITGALKAHKVRQVEGYISNGVYSDLLAWYQSTTSGQPGAGTWFPIQPPTASAEVIISGGVKSTRYTVQLALVEVI